MTSGPAAALPTPQGKQGSLFVHAPDPQGSWVQIPCGEIKFHHQRHTRWHDSYWLSRNLYHKTARLDVWSTTEIEMFLFYYLS
jgi:hypothetical protein